MKKKMAGKSKTLSKGSLKIRSRSVISSSKAAASKATPTKATTFRGANRPKAIASPKRMVLGRGLNALMSTAPVRVEHPGVTHFPHAVREPWEEGNAVRALEVDADELSPADAQLDTLSEIDLETSTEAGLRFLPISVVHPNPSQPRRLFTDREIDELSRSIRESGVLQPIIVRPARGSAREGTFEIVAGERRYRASLKAGLSEIPALVRDLSDKESLQLAIIENVQRADLNPVEEAHAYQRLIDDFGETQGSVAEAVGKDRVSVANALRLLKLAPTVQKLLISGALSAGHGRALLMVEQGEKQTALAEKIVREGLSVREAEALAGGKELPLVRVKQRGKGTPTARPAFEIELEDRIRRALGTKVAAHLTPSGAGEIRISFFSNGELQSLLERLGA